MKYILILITLSLSGCAGSRMVQTFGGASSKYAPSNEKKGGTVSYSMDARETVIKQSREMAYKRMHDFCGGPYLITREGQISSNGMALTTVGVYGAITSYADSKEWLIDFVCEN